MLDTSIPTDPFTQELQRIRRLIGEGQLQPAAVALNTAQRKAPTDARVPLLGMRLADQAGNLAGAIQAARRALKLAPGWPVAELELALLLARQGEADEAMTLARRALASEPNDLQVRVTAINVANAARRHDDAITWLQEGLAQQPEHQGMRLSLGQLLGHTGQHAAARAQFEWLAERAPNHPDVLRGLLSCALATKEQAEAVVHADALLALNPDDEHTRYWHAIAHGKTPKSQPREMVSELFNADFAKRFDLHLVSGLKYRVPERIAQLLIERHPDRRFNLLDLGCGTGLVGVFLGPIEGFIIGVDLSEKMIEQAARHNIYARFHRVNVLDALADTPGNHYEAITCADVLVYVGDLAPVIPNALRILKPGGHFIFSCEAASEDEADLVLRPETNRYAHKASAVERQCREAGFDEVLIEDLPVLRMEGEAPLPGFLVTARKPLAA